MNNVYSFLKNHPTLNIVIGFQLFRLLLLPYMGLMPQDAYYHFYGEHLALSYFDHPGMIGYILRLFTSIFGKTVFAIKLADFTITSLTLLSFFKLSAYFLPDALRKKALVLLTTTICFSILSLNSTPDVPLLLFWTLSLISLSKAIFENDKKHWIFAGIAMGLAFDSKYTALLLPIGLLLFILFSNNYRKLLTSPWLWSSLLIAALVTSPVWIWNYENEFASFLFQSSNRTGSISKFQFQPRYLFGAIGHQIVLVLPVLLFLFVKITYKYLRNILVKFDIPDDKKLFLLAFFIPTFFGFTLLTPIYWVKLNWMMPSYITGVLIASNYISKKGMKIHVISAVVLHLIASLQIVSFIAPIKSDDTWVGWKELVTSVEALQKEESNTFVFADDSYKTTACMSFFTEQKIYAQNIIGKHALQFDYIGDDLKKLTGKNALFIDSDKRFKNPLKKGNYPEELDSYFSRVTELKPIIIKINGKESRKFWVYRCENYRVTPKIN